MGRSRRQIGWLTRNAALGRSAFEPAPLTQALLALMAGIQARKEQQPGGRARSGALLTLI